VAGAAWTFSDRLRPHGQLFSILCAAISWLRVTTSLRLHHVVCMQDRTHLAGWDFPLSQFWQGGGGGA